MDFTNFIKRANNLPVEDNNNDTTDNNKEINQNVSTLTPLDSFTPGIEELYENVNIFITGSTGFIGKVLVEKLLRSCPGINQIYILLRKKHKQDESERLKKMLNIPLYDKLRAENPKAFDKLRIIGGNLEQLNIGISKDDEKFLIDNINFIFHCGASVRFDDPLQKAILLNTRGTREIVRLAKRMKYLKAFVHVSTAYTNCENHVIDEIIYPPKADWRSMIKMAETMKSEQMNALQDKLIDKLPNTYIFSKALAELIVHENKDNFPCVIFRPSIVSSTANDPMPGWVDNFNGPIGLVVGCGSGLVHAMYGADIHMEHIQVDLAVRVIIASAWYQSLRKDWTNCLIINGGVSEYVKVTLWTLRKKGLPLIQAYPFHKILWYPFGFFTTNKLLYQIMLYLFHVIPGAIFDLLFELFGSQNRVMKLYRKIHYSNMALKHFMFNEWKFIFKNFHSLGYVIKPEDQLKFSLDHSNYKLDDQLKSDYLGIKKYLLKEKISEENTLKARRQLRNMSIIHYLLLGFLSVCIIYIFGKISRKCDLFTINFS